MNGTSGFVSVTTSRTDHRDFGHLTLPDGRRADRVDRFELALALMKLGIPGVTAESGQTDALRAFDNHLNRAKAEALQ